MPASSSLAPPCCGWPPRAAEIIPLPGGLSSRRVFAGRSGASYNIAQPAPDQPVDMSPQNESLDALEESARRDLGAAVKADALEAWRVAYLGRRGRLTQVLRGLSELPLEERRAIGGAANRLKAELEALYQERRVALDEAHVQQVIGGAKLDVTLPGPPLPRGRLHIITQTLRDILRAFTDMGFQVVEGPEVEWDRYNFQALRIPPDHPARDMWDTLWIDYQRDGQRPMLLRTHTSPNQIRVMEQSQPPVRVVVPGRCYRFEATDPTHEWMMVQGEGLAIEEGISMTDLKG